MNPFWQLMAAYCAWLYGTAVLTP